MTNESRKADWELAYFRAPSQWEWEPLYTAHPAAPVDERVASRAGREEAMTVVAIMQNQWFHNPESARRVYERHPERRERLIKFALFRGCKSGRVLQSIFGADWCERIVWEEASKEVGSRASSRFTADLDHLRAVVAKHSPQRVLAFGQVAGLAMQVIVPPEILIVGPHPAARGPNVMPALRQMRVQLDTALIGKP